MRIPYPIPEPERSKLIAAGKIAINQKLDAAEQREASKEVRKVIAEIELRYGIEEENGW